MNAAGALLASTSLFAAAVTLWRWVARANELSRLVAYELRFPRGLETESVEGFVSAISGLLPPWWKRWLHSPVVIFETVADHSGIHQRLLVAESHRHQVEDMMQAHLPAARYTRPDNVDTPNILLATSYRLSAQDRTLRVDAPRLSLGLLTSLQPLRKGEEVTVQWVLSPAGPVAPARAARPSSTKSTWLPTDDGTREDGEAVSALRAKQAAPLLHAVARIGVSAATSKRARSLVHKVESAWHPARAPGVHFQRSIRPEGWTASDLTRRLSPLFAWPLLLNAQELSGLLGIPVEAEQVPGLLLGGCRQLAPSPAIPSSGVVLGRSTFPGSERAIALDAQAQLRHLHAVGPTGTGKSTLLLNLIIQDLALGRGVTVLDPKGDLVADILERIPAHRRDDVIVVDAADEIAPVGINPLRAVHGNGEVIVENLVGLMHSLWSFSWGPRMDDILRAAMLTLVQRPGMSLVEVPALLLQDSFRQRFLGALDDPVGLESFWGWYQNLSDAERSTVVAAPLNKLRAFTMRPRIRRIIGQSDPKLDMREVLRDGKIVLVNLASGLLGQDAAALLGALIVAELWNATTARAGLPQRQRRLHVAYLDEFQHFLHLPTPIATVLAEARGLGLGMVLAHQHLHQLPAEIRQGVLANARSRVVFQVSRNDATVLARELSSTLTPDDLQGLGAYEIVASVFAGGQVSYPCTARTLPAPPITSSADEIRDTSRARYGQSIVEIDADIASRTATRSAAPIGTTARRGKGRRAPGGAS